MRRAGVWAIVVSLSFPIMASADLPLHRTAHYRIYSGMQPSVIEAVEQRAEAFYHAMTPAYFANGFEEPLAVFYFRVQATTREYVRQRRARAASGRAQAGVATMPQPAAFTHHWMDSGRLVGWGQLFHEITHHFIHVNYGDAPVWFHEGLASFLGEQTRVENGTLSVGRPDLRRERSMSGLLDGRNRIEIRRLFSLSKAEFYQSSQEHYSASRTLFYWLHAQGQLKQFLQAVQEEGFELSTLERTVSRSVAQIDEALAAFLTTRHDMIAKEHVAY